MLSAVLAAALAGCGGGGGAVGDVPTAPAGPATTSSSKPAPPPDVTPSELRGAWAPASCGHDAARMTAYRLPRQPANPGFGRLLAPGAQHAEEAIPAPVFTDLTGDGSKDAVAVYQCSAGADPWPDLVVLYRSGGVVAGVVDLGTVDPKDHATVTGLAARGQEVTVSWRAYQAPGDDVQLWTARLRWEGEELVLADRTATAKGRVVSGFDRAAFATPSGRIVCDLWARRPADGASYVRCDITGATFDPGPRPADCGDLSFGGSFAIEAGKARHGCVAKQPNPALLTVIESTAWHNRGVDPTVATAQGPAAVLGYGATMRVGDISCVVAETGVTCKHAKSGSSFSVARERFALS